MNAPHSPSEPCDCPPPRDRAGRPYHCAAIEPARSGPYSAGHGLCANGHAVNGYGRCEPLNGPGYPFAPEGSCERAATIERAEHSGPGIE